MYKLFRMTLLMVSSLGFATPARPLISLPLINPSPSASNPIGPEPIDPRFSLQAMYRAMPLNQDQCLTTAVLFMGLLGSLSFVAPLPSKTYWDRYLPNVEITHRSPRTGGTIEERFLIWGLYLGVKDMIESNRFKEVQFVLRWEGQIVGIMGMRKPAGALPLSGMNSTSDMRRRLFSSLLNLTASQSLDGTSFSPSVPDPPSSPNLALHLEIAGVGGPLPKYNIIMALLEGILAVAPRAPGAQVLEPVQVEPPPPYDAILQVVPEQTAYGQPRLTYGFVALTIRQIPAILLLQARRWAEVNFRIVVDGVVVARGSVS